MRAVLRLSALHTVGELKQEVARASGMGAAQVRLARVAPSHGPQPPKIGSRRPHRALLTRL